MTQAFDTADFRLGVLSRRGPVAHTDSGEPIIQHVGGLTRVIPALANSCQVNWIAFAPHTSPVTRLNYNFAEIAKEKFNFPISVSQYVDSRANLKASDWFCANVLWPLLHNLPMPDLDLAAISLHWDDLKTSNQNLVTPERISQNSGVLINDFQLAPTAGILRELGFTGPIAFFLHTPWPGLAKLTSVALSLLTQLAEQIMKSDIVYFQTPTDLLNFKAFVTSKLGAENSGDYLVMSNSEKVTFLKVAPVSVDPNHLEKLPHISDPALKESDLLFVHIARSDPSKNSINVIKSFSEFVRRQKSDDRNFHLDLHIVPSRQEWGNYQTLLAKIMKLAQQVNLELDAIQPNAIRIHTSANYALALGSLRRFDVLLAPSIADGMNLVVKEGCSLNSRNGVVIATSDVGAMSELAQFCITAKDASVSAILEAIHTGFELSDQVREKMTQDRQSFIKLNNSAKWAEKVAEPILDLHQINLAQIASLPVTPHL